MIQVEHAHLPVVAHSDPGTSGKNNEDRFSVSAYQLGRKDATPSLLVILADGIGGHRAGEVAAEMAVEIVRQRVADSDAHDPVSILEDAVVDASRKIYAQAQEEPAYLGMGATCACAWIIGSRVYAATVGDSRIYLLRDGAIHQLSTDHTWVQEALESGILQPEEIYNHPNAHVIRRYLGSPVPPQVDFRLRFNGWENDVEAESNQGMRLLKNDRLLLCSDGLTDLVMDDEICLTLESQPLDAAVHSLIDLANERGGHDNITLIALEMPDVPGVFPVRDSRRRLMIRGCLAVILLAALTAVLFGLHWLRSSDETTVTPLPAVEILSTTTPLPALSTYPAALPTPLAGKALSTDTPALPLPVQGGATLTPWPTNTLAPAVMASSTASASAIPSP